MIDSEFVQAMAAEMQKRAQHEQKIVHENPEEIENLYYECLSQGDPYYSDYGQFCGGIITERFHHPFDKDRNIEFTTYDDATECVSWIPFEDYPYPV